jgi:hypothetical protein
LDKEHPSEVVTALSEFTVTGMLIELESEFRVLFFSSKGEVVTGGESA